MIGAGIQAGARELLEMSATLDREDDARGVGVRPVYAIDSNVAIFLSQPSDHAADEVRGGVGRIGFGTILDGDPPALADVVSHALAEHLYVNLRYSAPLLLIPPVAHEVHVHALKLAREHVSPRERELRKWRSEGERFLGQLDRTKGFGDDAERLIGQMQDVLFLRYGPAAALRRLRRVFGERGIVSSDVAGPLLDDDLRAALDLKTSSHDLVRLTVRANEWMTAGVSRGRNDGNDFNDAFVIARLERANEILEARRSRHRIVYITADRNLLETVGAGGGRVGLRHPRAWLTRLGIFQFDEASGRQPLIDLLRFRLRATEEAVVDGQDASHDEWLDYLKRATESFIPVAQTRDLFFHQARDMLERYSANIERFQDEISELQDLAYENCFEVVTETAATEAQRSDTYYARTVPPLVFERWPATQRRIETFLSWHVKQDFDVALFREGLHDIDREDPSRYARYLALGTVFAGRGQWGEAVSLALRANALADSGGSGLGRPNGREGAFFEAVARRHCALSVDDLHEAELALRRCREIAERESLAYAAAGSPDGPYDIVPERFEAEGMASDTTRFYFERYGRGNLVVQDDRDRALPLIARFEGLLERLRPREADAQGQGASSAAGALHQLIIRTVTNMLGLAIVARSFDVRSERAWSEAERLGLTGEGMDHVSSAVAITLLAYKRLSGRGRSARENDLLRRHLLEHGRYYVFPYDRARYEEIGRLLGAR